MAGEERNTLSLTENTFRENPFPLKHVDPGGRHLQEGPSGRGGAGLGRLLPPCLCSSRGTEQGTGEEAAKGPASSGDPRPGRGHRRDRGDEAHPFRGQGGGEEGWNGGEAAATGGYRGGDDGDDFRWNSSSGEGK